MQHTAVTRRTARVDQLVPPLADREVLVVGCGSVGSAMADILVRHGVGGFTLVDPDDVEAPNLSRSVYRHDDIGRLKVEALAEHLHSVDPTTRVRKVHHPLSALPETRQADIIAASTVVIAATDDPVAQAALNHRCYALGVPAVFPALYRGAHAGEVVITVPEATPCWTCATGSSAGPSGTRDKDYGTGRLAAETALGADILTVVSVAAKHTLGLLGGAGSPAGALTLRALARHSMCLIATAPEWDWFPPTFASVPGQFAPQSVWLSVTGSPQCSVCGVDRQVPLTPVDLTHFDPSAGSPFQG